jgi:PAS domain S-box-containing protein
MELPNTNSTTQVFHTRGGAADHFVQFYEHEEFLVESVCSFIGEGLRAGTGAIVFATPSHRAAIGERLLAEGFALDGGMTPDQYIALDAAEVLAEFMVNGAPDELLFQEVVGGIVKKTGGHSHAKRAFGEMVALLWADGNRAAAARLEELWGDFTNKFSLSLFCAYPMSGFGDSCSTKEFARICRAHSRVLPSERYFALQGNDRLREIALLQQRAAALEAEVCRRKQAEARERALIERALTATAKFQAVFNQSGILAGIMDLEGNLREVNDLAVSWCGCTREQVLGRPFWETPWWRGSETMKGRIRAATEQARSGAVFREVLRYWVADGTERVVDFVMHPIRDESGAVRFLHPTGIDITERVRVQESVARLAAIVEHSDDAIISKDLNGVIKSWNQGAERLFGYTAEEAISRPVTMLIPEGRLDEEPGILDRIRRGESIENYETVRRRKDGTLVDISLTVSPVKDAEGNVIGASKVARDITDKVRAKEKLKRTVAERTASLREAVAQMEEFSYTVSHDLRAPLRGMQAYAEALLQDFGALLPPEAAHYLNRIAANAFLLDRMILDVLTFSRVARAELRLEAVNLNRLVHKIIEQYPGMQAPHAQIEIEPLHDVLGHEPSLTQALSNLLNNAVKFVAPDVKPKVLVWSERQDGRVRIWVADNGIGVNPQYQHRLFNMFERIHPDLKYEGTGVGLAIVRKAVQRMGGKAGMESDGVSGSRFWIELGAVAGK